MAERNTPRRTGGYDYVEAYEMAGNTTIEAGKMVALLTSSGYAVAYSKHSSAADKIVVGRCEETVRNTGADGAARVRVRTGVFRWDNDVTGKVVTRAHIADKVFADDDQTIRNDSDGNKASAAGRLIAVDAAGAWVATGIPFLY